MILVEIIDIGSAKEPIELGVVLNCFNKFATVTEYAEVSVVTEPVSIAASSGFFSRSSAISNSSLMSKLRDIAAG